MNQPAPTQQEEESLRIKTGYVQHTNHTAPNTDPSGKIIKVLWELKKTRKLWFLRARAKTLINIIRKM